MALRVKFGLNPYSGTHRCARCRIAFEGGGFWLRLEEDGGRMALGTDVVMLGSVRPDDGLASPRAAGAATQALCVRVADPDAHFERARAAGAEIVAPPADTDFGARQYCARDPEGHLWVFGTFGPDAG